EFAAATATDDDEDAWAPEPVEDATWWKPAEASNEPAPAIASESDDSEESGWDPEVEFEAEVLEPEAPVEAASEVSEPATATDEPATETPWWESSSDEVEAPVETAAEATAPATATDGLVTETPSSQHAR